MDTTYRGKETNGGTLRNRRLQLAEHDNETDLVRKIIKQRKD